MPKNRGDKRGKNSLRRLRYNYVDSVCESVHASPYWLTLIVMVTVCEVPGWSTVPEA